MCVHLCACACVYMRICVCARVPGVWFRTYMHKYVHLGGGGWLPALEGNCWKIP